MSQMDKITTMLHMPTDMKSKGMNYDMAREYGIAAKTFMGMLSNVHELQNQTDGSTHNQAISVHAH